jgi:hypothetical protein
MLAESEERRLQKKMQFEINVLVDDDVHQALYCVLAATLSLSSGTGIVAPPGSTG